MYEFNKNFYLIYYWRVQRRHFHDKWHVAIKDTRCFQSIHNAIAILFQTSVQESIRYCKKRIKIYDTCKYRWSAIPEIRLDDNINYIKQFLRTTYEFNNAETTEEWSFDLSKPRFCGPQ
jgi:hypothetical protein